MPNVLVQGASRGIGLQFCRALVNRGSTVLACCRNPTLAKDLRELQSQHPSQVDVIPLDVTNEEAIIAAAEHVKQTHGGKLDLLINSSGILSPKGRGETSLKDVSLQALQETVTVNTLGPLLMAKYFSPLLGAGNGTFGRQAQSAKENHAAVLVNMSARVGSIGDNRLGGWYSYRMSKAALNMATKNLSIELGRGRRRVICVALHPGTVDTDLSRPYHKNVPKSQLFSREQSVNYLLSVIDGLTIHDSGKYLAWDGSEIPF
ncbi:C-signal-like [Penaeus indicus]|uniref:C-signal-like n=1 Tax=Penaeus indicus TaxID=29960 RepID=UPI00300D10B1